MAQKTSKIDRLGLSERVQALVAGGTTSRDRIAEILTAESGASISSRTIGRYIASIKDVAHSKAFQIISDHVDKVVPDDLDALERMERLCLQWSQEAAKDTIERVAAATEDIRGELQTWISALLNGEDSAETIKFIISKCLSYIQRDANLQEQRLKAMRMAVQIIDLKLSKAGLLDDDQRGRIVFLKREENLGSPPPGLPRQGGGEIGAHPVRGGEIGVSPTMGEGADCATPKIRPFVVRRSVDG